MYWIENVMCYGVGLRGGGVKRVVVRAGHFKEV